MEFLFQFLFRHIYKCERNLRYGFISLQSKVSNWTIYLDSYRKIHFPTFQFPSSGFFENQNFFYCTNSHFDIWRMRWLLFILSRMEKYVWTTGHWHVLLHVSNLTVIPNKDRVDWYWGQHSFVYAQYPLLVNSHYGHCLKFLISLRSSVLLNFLSWNLFWSVSYILWSCIY